MDDNLRTLTFHCHINQIHANPLVKEKLKKYLIILLFLIASCNSKLFVQDRIRVMKPQEKAVFFVSVIGISAIIVGTVVIIVVDPTAK